MSDVAIVLAEFAVCGAVIVGTGLRLSRLGQVVAERTGLGGTWVGLLLLATVTSLPELVTGASAILLHDVPDIAAGDAIGSCLFNLLILAMLDVRDPEPLTARMHQGHVLAAGFGLVQLGLLGLAIVSGRVMPSILWIGLPSIGFVAVYVLAVRSITESERARLAGVVEEVLPQEPSAMSLRAALMQYAATAGVLVIAASLLPALAEQLAALTGTGQTFIGTTLVAAATSLPEVVVSVAAARLGAIDMAAANLLGSNLFNVVILGIDDLLYTKGPLMAAIGPAHLTALLGTVLMTGIAIVGLTIRARRKRFRLSWDALAIVCAYFVTLALVAQNG